MLRFDVMGDTMYVPPFLREMCDVEHLARFGRSFNMIQDGDKDGIWQTLEKFTMYVIVNIGVKMH